MGHEYFHNWTGNRVTCRDWFQLTLKEGLTVYRDQVGAAFRAVVPQAHGGTAIAGQQMCSRHLCCSPLPARLKLSKPDPSHRRNA